MNSIWEALVPFLAPVMACVLALFVVWRKTKTSAVEAAAASGGGGELQKAKVPRGAMAWPLIGETLEFMSCAYSGAPERFVDERRRRYGKVFRTHLFGATTIVSADAEVNRAVLQSDERAFVPSYPASLTELMGKASILVLGGAMQRKVHGLLGGFLKSPELKERVTADMRRQVRLAMAGWDDGEVVRFQGEAKSIVFGILVKALIGLEPGDPEMQQLRHHFQDFIAGLVSLPIKLPGMQLYKSLKAKDRVEALIHAIIKEKRTWGARMVPMDAIDALMINGGNEMTDELILDNMVDFMIPAEDSVPILITLVILFLSRCPLALQQLEEENLLLEKRKSMSKEELQWTDYMSLSFTQNVITETLRLGNIITGIIRKAVRDVEIKGHLIPKGWCIFTYFRSVHLDESLHDDAYDFNPWRWIKKDSSKSAFTPFGGGLRMCPGAEMARLEASVFLHHFITVFRWVAEEEDHIVHFPTVRMKRGLPIRLFRRQIPQ